jgi:hypothetical protein
MQVVDPQLLPCTPAVRVIDDLVELSCKGDTLPGILERSLGTSGTTLPPSPPTELEPPATLEVPSTETVPTTAAPPPVETVPPTEPPPVELPPTEPPPAELAPTEPPPAEGVPPEGGTDGGG